MPYDKTFNHNQTEVPYDITIFFDNNKDEPWGVKEVIVLVNKCNMYCWSCFGGAITQCWSCNQDEIMKLSGTTCNETCLNGYGDTFDGSYCILCDLLCKVCFELDYNCSSCTVSGPNRAFLWEANSSCEYTCP